MPGKKGGLDIPITLSYAAEQLRVDRHCLRDWKDNKNKILMMKKGALRHRGRSVGREPEMEFKLNAQFEQARAIGRVISSKWFISHAKAIYQIQYPRRISQDEVTRKFEYEHFSFSNT
jgi:hypothetical protein